jgi:hypothetical protein
VFDSTVHSSPTHKNVDDVESSIGKNVESSDIDAL